MFLLYDIVHMNNLDFLKFENIIHAVIIRHTYKNKPVDFFTEDTNPFQMGMFTRDKGYSVEPHKHTCTTFEINSVQEFIFVKSGQIEMSFFTDSGQKYETLILNKGDSVLTLCGGHSLIFLKKSTLLEIKQGPYSENKKEYY